MRIDGNSFGDLVTKLLPSKISLAKLSREADVDYAYLHSLIRGKRGDKSVQPSMDMVVKVTEALERLGAEVPLHWEIDLLETAAKLPDGFSITKDIDVDENSGPPENFEDWPQELQEALGFTRELPRQTQLYIYQLWREQARAHFDIDKMRQDAEAKLIERQRLLNERAPATPKRASASDS